MAENPFRRRSDVDTALCISSWYDHILDDECLYDAPPYALKKPIVSEGEYVYCRVRGNSHYVKTLKGEWQYVPEYIFKKKFALSTEPQKVAKWRLSK